MFGLNEWIARGSDGTTLLIVVAVAALLGLRHATDPDHLAAVTTLIATGDDRSGQAARRLGLVWGLGHATTLFVFGLPIVFYSAYLPGPVQQGAETAVGVMIVALAVLALFTAVSMWIVSAGWGLALSRPSVRRSPDRVTPALGLASLAFGVWYALGALTLVPNWEI